MVYAQSFIHKFAVAPMLDWTDKHCRYFHRMLTKYALLYTEMVVADAIIYGDRDSFLSYLPILKPLALQLGGSDPKKLAQATIIASDYGYDEINLNVGCPSTKVQNGSFGACLMLEPEKVGECIAAMKAVTSIPITIKCRIAVDEQDIETALDNLANSTEADGFWIHARKAWLKGLSPKENRVIPPLNYERVYSFKAKYPNNFVGINGGIQYMHEVLQHLTKVDAVMVGRMAYKFPKFLTQVDSEIYESSNVFNIDELAENIYAYANNLIENGGRLAHIAKHMHGLFAQQQGAKYWRQALGNLAADRTSSAKDLYNLFQEMKNI